ncbi:unnamed protein product [Paramecium primaurelia]|uniref:Uncharacterized protein n=1 Tax=Paramecium primaurelia TaxID=5886 RepID=A0A8S1PJW9_PARPR|nr:unnamed protein product [Paramecium primaurelia]
MFTTVLIICSKIKTLYTQNLNELDVSTGQICSIEIFFASIKYINEQQGNKSTSVLIEMILILLCLKQSYLFVIDLLRVYYKKYKILLLSDALKIINCNLSLTIYVNRKLNQMKDNNIYFYNENKNQKKFKKIKNSFIINIKILIRIIKQLQFIKFLINIQASTGWSQIRYIQKPIFMNYLIQRLLLLLQYIIYIHQQYNYSIILLLKFQLSPHLQVVIYSQQYLNNLYDF